MDIVMATVFHTRGYYRDLTLVLGPRSFTQSHSSLTLSPSSFPVDHHEVLSSEMRKSVLGFYPIKYFKNKVKIFSKLQKIIELFTREKIKRI